MNHNREKVRHIHKRDEASLYVLLTDTGTWFSTLIKQVTSAPYNHASLSLDANLKDLYSFGRKRPYNPWVAGFVREDVYGGVYRRFPHTRCMLLRLPVSYGQKEKTACLLEAFEEHEGVYRYNLVGLFGVLLNFSIERDNAFFCSQFVAEVLGRTGIQLWERSSGLVTPFDFGCHPAFEIVYEGYLYDYAGLDQSRMQSRSPVSFQAL
ncbi:hypothetical protein [Paenibacillus massiliensis]|uniref:hypothetical protein n=1 Tax=Paenibacillus massiliensis TaxID=225917 RepID=UPI00037B5972|nr:hypothetical protein [Paenibacillus massiliensis]